MKLLLYLATPTLWVAAQSANGALGMPPWVNNVTSLGALIFVVYWFTKAIDRRDATLKEQTTALVTAVSTFEKFEEEERSTHTALAVELKAHTAALAQISATLTEVAATQRETVSMLGELRADLRRNHQERHAS